MDEHNDRIEQANKIVKTPAMKRYFELLYIAESSGRREDHAIAIRQWDSMTAREKNDALQCMCIRRKP